MEKTLEKIIKYAVHVAEPEQIILFGSMANGIANVYSDVDLLIICENSASKKYSSEKIKSFCKEYCLKTDILIYTRAEINDLIKNPVSFLSAVINHGKTVYKKNLEV